MTPAELFKELINHDFLYATVICSYLFSRAWIKTWAIRMRNK